MIRKLQNIMVATFCLAYTWFEIRIVITFILFGLDHVHVRVVVHDGIVDFTTIRKEYNTKQ